MENFLLMLVLYFLRSGVGNGMLLKIFFFPAADLKMTMSQRCQNQIIIYKCVK